MIDRSARDRLAELLRKLAAGTLTMAQFETNIDPIWAESQDRAVESVLDMIFDELLEPESLPIGFKRFRGRHRLQGEARRRLVITTIFLHSNYELEWPADLQYPYGYGGLFLWLCAMVAVSGMICIVVAPWMSAILLATTVFLYFQADLVDQHVLKKWAEQQKTLGRDYDVWPFLRRSDFDRQLAAPKLLSG